MDVRDTASELADAGGHIADAASDGFTTVAERLHLRRRRPILGLPIGPKRTDWAKVGAIGAGAAAVVAGTVGAVRLGPFLARRRGASEAGDGADEGGSIVDDIEEELEELSGDERALVKALRQVEQDTERAIASIASLERDADGGEGDGWVMTVGLRAQGPSANGIGTYRVIADQDGSVRDCVELDGGSDGED